jgi:hypothetical protein
VRLHSEYNLEALVWCLVLGVFLLRFMTLGTKINRKYRNLSVLITEQVCVCAKEIRCYRKFHTRSQLYKDDKTKSHIIYPLCTKYIVSTPNLEVVYLLHTLSRELLYIFLYFNKLWYWESASKIVQ